MNDQKTTEADKSKTIKKGKTMKKEQMTENMLADQVLKALEDSDQIKQQIKLLKGHINRKNRLNAELEQFHGKKAWLEAGISHLRKNFGESDGAADLAKLEDFTLKLKPITEAIDLLEKRLDSNLHGPGSVSRDIREYELQLNSAIFNTLSGIGIEWQEQLDREVDAFISFLMRYTRAASRVHDEQNLIDRKYFNHKSVRDILPKIKKFDRLERFSNDLPFMAMLPGKQLPPEKPIINVNLRGPRGTDFLRTNELTAYGRRNRKCT